VLLASAVGRHKDLNTHGNDELDELFNILAERFSECTS
jgi:hypothetical protein